jgi:hypothetical protein
VVTTERATEGWVGGNSSRRGPFNGINASPGTFERCLGLGPRVAGASFHSLNEDDEPLAPVPLDDFFKTLWRGRAVRTDAERVAAVAGGERTLEVLVGDATTHADDPHPAVTFTQVAGHTVAQPKGSKDAAVMRKKAGAMLSDAARAPLGRRVRILRKLQDLKGLSLPDALLETLLYGCGRFRILGFNKGFGFTG